MILIMKYHESFEAMMRFIFLGINKEIENIKIRRNSQENTRIYSQDSSGKY